MEIDKELWKFCISNQNHFKKTVKGTIVNLIMQSDGSFILFS